MRLTANGALVMSAPSPALGKNEIGSACAEKMPATMKTAINMSLKAVATFWNRPPKTTLCKWTNAATVTMPMESSSGEAPGVRLAKYLAKAIAASAIGAANPTVADNQPDRKPTDG